MPSVTFHAVCPPSNKRKDGTIPVKIRVTFKGLHRYLATTLIARPGDLTRSLAIKSPDITRKAQALIAQMQDALTDVTAFDLEGWDIDGVVGHIRARLTERTFRLDMFVWAEQMLGQTKTPATRRVYDAALNSLAEYIGERRLDVNEVTRRLLLGWMEWTDTRPKRNTRRPGRGGQSSRNVTLLAHIYKAAQAKYNDDDRTLIPRNPFDNLPRVTPPAQGQKPLTPELMQRVISDTAAAGRERIALDAFVLSFCLMGANLADLWEARGALRVGEVWRYQRAKTRERRADRAEMRVTIPPEAVAYLGRLAGCGEWWLNALHTIPGNKDGCTHKVNIALRKWAERNGVEPFTFYAARKTWATIARSKAVGIEKARVDECLAHIGDFRLTDIYAERDFAAMDEANARVLATLHF